MRLFTKATDRPEGRVTIRELTELAVCTAVIFVLQVTLAILPNIETTTLLIMLYTRWFRRKTLWIIYVFAVLEGVYYGFQIWWVMYLYVWTILWLAVLLLERKPRSVYFWAAVGSIYGLMFGFLCSFPYLVVGGVYAAVSWWIAGIPFDLIHGFGNFILILVLYKPLNDMYQRIRNRTSS
ncbi:hypothetical protein [Faecalispora anaeroviscerum]|uniref:hypothetical protein n=1 Tax=Faecalispora anaeroviscerum TaxID=2991836 RepID=UPI0024BB7F44|nr:hypothetical protein [Faecalispora anaeroviscerum]